MQGRYDLALSIQLRLRSPKVFDFIRAHGLLPQLPSRVPQLLRIDASQAIHLLVEEREAVPPSAVVPAIQVRHMSQPACILWAAQMRTPGLCILAVDALWPVVPLHVFGLQKLWCASAMKHLFTSGIWRPACAVHGESDGIALLSSGLAWLCGLRASCKDPSFAHRLFINGAAGGSNRVALVWHCSSPMTCPLDEVERSGLYWGKKGCIVVLL